MPNYTRRQFLKVGTAAATATAAYAHAGSSSRIHPERQQYVIVWLRGGMSPLESFDPKPDAASEIRGETSSISTSVPGIDFSELFPRLARLAAKICVLRSLVPGNDQHGIAEASLLSGTPAIDVQSNAANLASYGAELTAQYGPLGDYWPHFQIGEELDRRYGGGGTGRHSYLTGPLIIPSSTSRSSSGLESARFPGEVSRQRLLATCGPRPSFARFEEAWVTLAGRLRQVRPTNDCTSCEVSQRLIESAHRWFVSAEDQSSLDLTQELAATRTRYGQTAIGNDCLLARRLIEAGARCVTVTSGGWDLHRDITAGMRNQAPQLDAALAALIEDLDQRGLLRRTTVVGLTDFGRTPQLNEVGGRDHWGQTGVALLAGGNTPAGSVIGRTDRHGGRVLDNPIQPEDVKSFF